MAAAAAVAACHGSSAGPEYPRDRKLRLNDVQVRGTHNSYHPPLPPPERQLDEGMRQLELDVFGDPSGRFFVHLRIFSGERFSLDNSRKQRYY